MRLFRPERAVVVERRDALGGRHEVRRRLRCVTRATKSTIACFAAPSFHDGSGSPAGTPLTGVAEVGGRKA